jgi:hypothetical protein
MFLRGAALVALLSAFFMPAYFGGKSVSAHVHAVTPLNCTPANEDNAGGRAVLDTPAAIENGGPIQRGPIPLNTGNAAFDPETGGGNHASPPGCE